jgi:hypothetical protein
MFDLGRVLTLYPPPKRPKGPLTAPAPTRQADVSAVSAAPAKVLTCPVRTGTTPGRTGTNDTEHTDTRSTEAPPHGGTRTRSEER